MFLSTHFISIIDELDEGHIVHLVKKRKGPFSFSCLSTTFLFLTSTIFIMDFLAAARQNLAGGEGHGSS